MVYDRCGQTRSTPVAAVGGRLQLTLPFEPHRALAFEGRTITAIATDNVDTWEQVE